MRRILFVVFATFALKGALSAQATATISGEVRISGDVIQVQVGLQLEDSSSQLLKTNSDEFGRFQFLNIAPGTYKLTVWSPGIQSLRVRSIQVNSGENRVLPPLELSLGSMADCHERPLLDYIRLFDGGNRRRGDLRGVVSEEHGALAANARPIANVRVRLICSGGVCGDTKTDSDGVFMFAGRPPSLFSIEFDHPEFYSKIVPEFRVREGVESSYFPIYLDRCASGDCNPKLRPPEAAVTCM